MTKLNYCSGDYLIVRILFSTRIMNNFIQIVLSLTQIENGPLLTMPFCFCIINGMMNFRFRSLHYLGVALLRDHIHTHRLLVKLNSFTSNEQVWHLLRIHVFFHCIYNFIDFYMVNLCPGPGCL
jgi:hypothetical protein